MPGWLFPRVGRGSHGKYDTDNPINAPMSVAVIQMAFKDALTTSGIRKKTCVHSLRHYAELMIMPSSNKESRS